MILLLAASGRYFYQNNKIGADETVAPIYNSSPDSDIAVAIDASGRIIINGENSGQRLKPLGDIDELRLPVVDNPGTYIDRLTVTLTLPKAEATSVQHKILAIHGVDSSYSEIQNSSTIRYTAINVASTATITIVAQLPKGMVSRSIFSQISSVGSNIKFSFWVYLALALPIFTFLFMIVFIRYTMRLNRIDVPSVSITAPPMAIPPALVGVLFHQRVTSREIAATLIDLALRKDIYILDRERGFAFGKGRFDQRLLNYEKILLSKIFKNNLSTDQQLMDERIQNHLYSRKVSLVSAGIYAIATRLGYFRENPRRVHAKYWLFGATAMIIGLTGFTLSFITKMLPPFTAFFWVGMMVSALIIIIMVGNIPIRTELGKEAMSNWLAFRRYLSEASPIPYSPTVHQLFQAYLPYAIVLDCEAAWARRFSEHSFTLPDWFLTDKNGLGLEDFCLALFPIVSYVGRSLAAIREPGFE